MLEFVVIRCWNLSLAGNCMNYLDRLIKQLILTPTLLLQVFSNAKISPDNIKLIANMLEFNSENNAEQFRPPLITTGNKSTVAAQEKEYFNSHIDRVNSILLGDNIEDIQMSACVRNYSKNVLTVGFLNDRVEDRLDLYKSTFDVVILNDPDFTDVIQLFECLQ